MEQATGLTGDTVGIGNNPDPPNTALLASKTLASPNVNPPAFASVPPAVDAPNENEFEPLAGVAAFPNVKGDGAPTAPAAAEETPKLIAEVVTGFVASNVNPPAFNSGPPAVDAPNEKELELAEELAGETVLDGNGKMPGVVELLDDTPNVNTLGLVPNDILGFAETVDGSADAFGPTGFFELQAAQLALS